jgi:hypothetical protein
MVSFAGILTATMLSLFAASPASTNFTLKSFDFGNGGVTSSSSSYNLNGTTGTQTGASGTNGVTIISSGRNVTQNASVPPSATLTNPSGSYNKLRIVINTAGNPSDTRYAVAISSNGFTTTNYVQSDNSVSPVLGIEDYQTYIQWGSATGFDVLGLQPNTTYAVKVSAYQGAFTATAFGPASANVATQPTTITFSVATTANSTPPFNINFAELAANTVFTANANALINLTTNAASGGAIYMKGANAGLLSSSKSFTIASATADLSIAASGYGAQVGTIGQTGGGPLSATAPFAGTINSVGQITADLQKILGLSSPVTGGSAEIKFMAKTTSSTPAANDYADTETIVAAMKF